MVLTPASVRQNREDQCSHVIQRSFSEFVVAPSASNHMGANLWTNAVLIHLNPGINGSAA
jgi:hypothetical protein